MPLLIAALLLLIFATLAFAFVAYLFAYPVAVAACLVLWLAWRAGRAPLMAALRRKLSPSGYVWRDTGEPWQGETYAQRGRKPTATVTAPRRAARIPPGLVGCSDDDGE